MAFVTGTATNQNDLIDRLATFLSTNAALVAAGEDWEIVKQQKMEFSRAYTGRIAFFSPPTGSATTTCPDAPPVDMPIGSCFVSFEGQLSCPTTGTYRICLDARCGVTIEIDGNIVLSDFRYSGQNPRNNFSNFVDMPLTAGTHAIRVMGHAAGAGTNGYLCIGLGWRKPGDGADSIIPAANLVGMTMHYGVREAANAIVYGSGADIRRSVDTRWLTLKGPGLDGSKEIYIDLFTSSYPQTDRDYITLGYAAGYSGGTTVGVSRRYQLVPMWNSPTQYWFVANGQRFIFVAKINTIYASAYCGLFYPYATPEEWLYPIAIGGCAAVPLKYTDVSEPTYTSFWYPWRVQSGSITDFRTRSSLIARMPNGTEMSFSQDGTSDSDATVLSGTIPIYRDPARQFRPAVTGQYVLTPIMLARPATGEVYGEFDGVYHINGYGCGSEDIVTIGGVNHLVVQSANTTGSTKFAAIRLE